MFKSGGTRTYLAYNASSDKLTVKFSDGAELKLGAHAYGYLKKKASGAGDED